MNRRILAGFILLPVVLAMSLIAAVAFLLNRDNGINAHMIVNQSDTDRARYAAEAGLQAVNATIQGMGCSGGFPDASQPVTNSNFGGAAYSAYSASSGGTSVTLVSAGSYNGTTVTLTRNNAIVYQSPAVTYTLQPDATAGNDIYIDSANANNNYGNATSMPLKKNQQNVLVKFDLSVLPAGSRPVSATLSLYGSGGLLNGVDLVRLTSAWVEGTGAASPLDGATWNTSNGSTAWTPGGGYHSVKLDSTIGVMGTWTNLNATDIATAWLSGLVPNNGVMLKSTGDLGILQYYSSDNADATKRPKIVFNYLVPCGATGPSDPVSGNVTLSPAADSFDDSGAVQANNGAASTLSLYSTPARDKRILMRFDASVIPTGSTISSAILRLYVSNVGGTTANTKAIWANAVDDPWVEGSGNNTNKNCPTTPTAGASWNYRTDCAGWSYVHPPNTVPAWAAMAPMPTARTNVMVASVGGKVYAIGGRLMSATYLKVVEEYDPATNTWTTKASMPTARSDAGVAVVNGLIYVMGGDTGGFSASSANEAYNPATNTWASKAAMTTGRRYLAAAAVNGKIYTLGGAKTSTAVKNNEMYDPPANTWTTKKQMSTARMYTAAQSANGLVYAIGGWSGSASLKTNEEYDPSTNSWTPKTQMPTATDSMGSAVLGNKIYLIGGMHGSSVANQVWRYDALADTYTAQADYPFADDMPAAAPVGGYLYSMGGDDATTTVYANHYRYDPGFPAPLATASNESNGNSPLDAGFKKGWIDFELKPLVQEWIDGVRPNNGVVITTEVADQFSVNSREAASNTPQLVITYTH